MRIRLTVWAGTDGGGCAPREVTITAPQGATSGDLDADRIARLIAETLGVRGDALCARDLLLDESVLLGHPPLLDGASVRLVERDGWVPARRRPATAATELAVIGGPDSGRSRALVAGAHTVGRSGADLNVADPSLSREHLRILVGPSGMTIEDLGSENGTRVDGRLIEGTVALAPGARVTAGRTTMVVRPGRLRPATTATPGDGTVVVSRSPSPIPAPPTVRVEVPRPPEPPARRGVPWLAALVPLPVAGALAWFLGPHLLLLAVMSPLMLLGTYASDRFGARRTYATARRRHTVDVADCERRRDAALASERSWRERHFPDLVVVSRLATTPGAAMWSRTPDSPVVLRVGTGEVSSAVTWCQDGANLAAPLLDAPVTVDLRAGSMAVTGELSHGLVDALIGQLVVLHSPTDLAVWTDRAQWDRACQVSTGSAAGLLREAVAELRTRAKTSEQVGSRAAPPATVVLVCDGTGLDSDAVSALTTLAHSGPAHRMLTIVYGDGFAAAPVQLVTGPTGAAAIAGTPGGRRLLTVDAVGPEWVARVSRAMTPLRDTEDAGTEPPASVLLAEVVEGPGARNTAADIVAHWARADDGAWATLGARAEGPYRIDLAKVGPHALVGGTTGSGKSELLRTLVAALAIEHPPEDLAVVLVDYKGGSAFAGLEPLPHIVGVVTDLDPALTARALTSLRAEVRRREHLFAECAVSDIAGYRTHRRRTGESLPHLARLVIVVDEFRALADELPDFVTGLVRLAAVGRSLGIHLVLATQRPAGVVTADMRANLGLRIALRMRDRTDSQDVIESDLAALLPRAAPGRALLRSGAEPLTTIQTALLAGPPDPEDLRITVRWSDGAGTTRAFPTTGHHVRSDLVTAVAEAARTDGRRPPPSPWLPPLPATLTWTHDLPTGTWALEDDPARQRQHPVTVDLAGLPHTAVAGGIGSGRTTTAFALIAGALAEEAERTHLYLVAEPTGPLSALAGIPQTGAMLDRSDPAALAWFVDRLAEDVRARHGRPGPECLFVVIDGWDILADGCDGLDHGALTDRLLATLREGYAVGLRAVVTGDRSVLTGRVARTLPQRLLLRPADDTDLAIAGVPIGSAPSQWPPGRLMRADDGHQLQVIQRDLATIATPPPMSLPWKVARLPDRVALDALAVPTRDNLGIGLSADPERPVAVGGPGLRRIVVLGSSGSGRTVTLAAIAHQAVTAGRHVCIVADPHALLAQRTADLGALATHVAWSGHDSLVALRRAHPDLAVVVDDIDRHLDSALVPALEQIAELAERDGGLIAVTGEGATIGLRARGVGAAVSRGRTGIVLGAPTPMDGDVLGVRLPRMRSVMPGRGWFVMDRRATPVQIGCAGG